MNEIAASLILGLLFRQILGFQWALTELAQNMARADANKHKPIEYQNLMTPRWVVVSYLLIFGGLAYVIISHLIATGWQGVLIDLVGFTVGMLASAGISSLAKFPTIQTYVHLALKTLKAREAGFRNARDPESAKSAAHCHWLLSTIAGVS